MMAERTLKQITERQRTFVRRRRQARREPGDWRAFRSQVQDLQSTAMSGCCRTTPKFAAAYAAYGYLLCKVDMRKQAAAAAAQRPTSSTAIFPLVKKSARQSFSPRMAKPASMALPYFFGRR